MSDLNYTPGEGVLLGLAIGDAVGVPFESYPGGRPALLADQWKGEYLPSIAPDENGRYWSPGETSDDTAMTVALAYGLLDANPPGTRPHALTYDARKVVLRYLHWHENQPRGEGGQVKRALDTWGRSLRARTPFPRDGADAHGPYVGSGALMRCVPIGLLFRDPEAVRCYAIEDARLTHWNPEAEAASVAFATLISDAVSASSRLERPTYRATRAVRAALYALEKADYRHTKVWWALQGATSLTETTSLSSHSSGDVADVLVTSLATVYRALETGLHNSTPDPDPFAYEINFALRLGGDTDTRLALAGAFYGALFGPGAFPAHLVAGVQGRDEIQTLERKLLALR